MSVVMLELKGIVPSKKNARRVRPGQSKAYLSAQITADIDALVIQAQSQRHTLSLDQFVGKRLHAHTVFAGMGNRKDLDNMHTTVLDVLQKARIIDNDRQVRAGSYMEMRTDGEPAVMILISVLE